VKVAALDLGSNTFLCLICDVKIKSSSAPSTPPGKNLEELVITQVYADEVEVVRLGQGLQLKKEFHPEALARADKCLQKFKKIIDQHQPEKILAMATAAAREAENKNLLFDLCAKHNIPLEIIPGEKEAQITYEGAISGMTPLSALSTTTAKQMKNLIIDIGGGSTEYILGESKKILSAQSLQMGCVKLKEKYISKQPTSDQEIFSCRKEIQDALSVLDLKDVDSILAVAGTPTTLAAVEIGGTFDPKKIDGYQLTLKNLESWLSKLQPLSIKGKMALGFPEGRADVIVVGIIILIETLKKFRLNSLTVSTRGVRYGVALEMARRQF